MKRIARAGAGLLAAVSLAASASIVSTARAETTEAPGPVHRIVVDGPISPAVDDFVRDAVDKAEAAGASLLVLQLDTPGGLLQSTQTIVQNLLASAVPVAVYVGPAGASATSAGVFITLAGHVAAMAPGTTIGAAHPVSGQGGDIGGEMGKKVENFAVSFVESIAEQRGRNVEWAASAVRDSVSITDAEALEKDVIDLVASDLADLLAGIDGLTVEVNGEERAITLPKRPDGSVAAAVVDQEMTLRQRLLNIITDPNIAYLLMMAGMLGLYMEFTNPGMIFPGVVGAICLLLALQAGQVLPINTTGALLIALGLAFLAMEAIVPSFGALGIGGLVAMTIGSLILYEADSQLRVDRSLIAGTAAVFGLTAFAIGGLVVADRKRRTTTGGEGLVGMAAVAEGALDLRGRVRVRGEIWNAIADERIEDGTPVRIAGLDGLTVRVIAEKKE